MQGKIKLVAKDGTSFDFNKENFVFNNAANNYEQIISISPAYDHGIKEYGDNNNARNFNSVLFYNNGSGAKTP